MGVPETSRSIKATSEIFNNVLEVCSSLLHYDDSAKDTLKYLNSRVDKKTQDLFSFGHFPDEKNIDSLLKYFNAEDLESIGVLNKWYLPDGDRTVLIYRGALENHNLIMPYKNPYGNIIALIGRSILNEDDRKALEVSKNSVIPKYKTTKFCKSVNLFSIEKAIKHILEKDSVIIVEGQLDCITAYGGGIKNIIALGGVAFTPYQFFTISRYTKNIYLLLDNDTGGITASNKIISKYGKLANIKKITLPNEFKDLDQYITKGRDIYDIVSQLQ